MGLWAASIPALTIVTLVPGGLPRAGAARVWLLVLCEPLLTRARADGRSTTSVGKFTDFSSYTAVMS